MTSDIASSIEQVFPRYRHTIQRRQPEPRAGTFMGGGGLGPGALCGGAQIDGVGWVNIDDSAQEIVGQLARINGAIFDGATKRQCGHFVPGYCHAVSSPSLVYAGGSDVVGECKA